MMYFAIQNVHSPYTLPPAWEVKEFPQMWDKTYANMLALLDSATANLTLALHRSGLWDDTLILWTSDNGGIGRGNNHGLRGHKHDPWEGGTRATAFLSGGFLPPAVRGQSTGPKLVHISDWYPTFAGGEEDKKACCAAVLLCCCAAVLLCCCAAVCSCARGCSGVQSCCVCLYVQYQLEHDGPASHWVLAGNGKRHSTLHLLFFSYSLLLPPPPRFRSLGRGRPPRPCHVGRSGA
jgi:hypothetical protein